MIARGGMFLPILNGQPMSVMIDDGPGSSNNWSGQFGVENRRDDEGLGAQHLGEEAQWTLSVADPR